MKTTKSASPRLHTSVPVPTWPAGGTEPSGESVTGPYCPADEVRLLLGLSWDDMAHLHDCRKLTLERRHGHLVVHEDDALRYCGIEELFDGAPGLWDATQAKGGQS